MSYIGVLDCNNFFVSCERLFRPDLRKVPVVVLSSNDGCIVARSKEIKDIGIPMGVPYFQVKDSLKDIGTHVFSSHFTLYRDVSRRVFEVMRTELDIVEQYSIDEAFFSVKDAEAEQVAVRLKEKVERLVGIPVSVGVASSKTQAKYVNTVAKRTNGVSVYRSDTWKEAVATIPLHSLWGVGAKRAQLFRRHGLETALQYLETDPERIGQLFGVEGARLWYELAGKPVYLITPQAMIQKSIMSSRSFKAPSRQLSVIEDALSYHIRHATVDLRSMGLEARRMRISATTARHGNFYGQGFFEEVALAIPTDDVFLLLKEATKVTKKMFRTNVPYKKVGVILSDFTPKSVGQGTLFFERNEARDQIQRAVTKLNTRYGHDTVQVGSHLKKPEWQNRQDILSPAYTTNWSDIATANCC